VEGAVAEAGASQGDRMMDAHGADSACRENWQEVCGMAPLQWGISSFTVFCMFPIMHVELAEGSLRAKAS